MDRYDNIGDSGIDKLDEIYYHRHGRTGPEGERTSAKSAGEKSDQLLTIQEVCELLQVRKTYIYWLTHQKKIPYIKMQGHLRFRKSAIDEWLQMQEIRNADTEEEIQDRL